MARLNASTRDIRYEACLQVAIGNYDKFLKDGERALTSLQSSLKSTNTATVAASPRPSALSANGPLSAIPSESRNKQQVPDGVGSPRPAASESPKRKSSAKPDLIESKTGSPKIKSSLEPNLVSTRVEGLQMTNTVKPPSSIDAKYENSKVKVTEKPNFESQLSDVANVAPSAAKTTSIDHSNVKSPTPSRNMTQTETIDPRRLLESEADKLANQAVELGRRGDASLLPQAISLMTAAINLNPQCPGYYGNRSLCFYNLADYPSSLNDANLALQFVPNSVKFLNRKASALLKMERFKEASDTVKLMLQIEPDCRRAVVIEEEVRMKAAANARTATTSTVAPPIAMAQNRKVTKPNDSVSDFDIAVISRLPRKVTSQTVRDLVCGVGNVSLAKPVHFIVDNLPFSRCVIFLNDNASARQVVSKLQNYPYGINCIQVELVDKSTVEKFQLSMTPPHGSNNGFSSSSSSDAEDNGDPEPRPLSSQLSVSSDASSTNLQVPAGVAGANNLVAASSNASVVKTKPGDASKPSSLFLGNVPIDCEAEEIIDLISERVPSVGLRFVVVKKPQWDYAFVNFDRVEDAEAAHAKLYKCRLGPVVLDVRLQGSTSSPVCARSTSITCESPSLNSALTSIRIENMPPNIQLHEFLNDIYSPVSAAAKCDFAIYKQSQWRHCFLNFETATAASAALKCLSTLPAVAAPIALKLCESRTTVTGAKHPGTEYVLSLSHISPILRIDNLDGAVNDRELCEMFLDCVKSLVRDTSFSVAYLSFSDFGMASQLLHHYQGKLIRRSNIVIRYATPKR